MYLPIERFKRKTDISDEDWFDSLPNATTELRKGRRDMLRAVIEAAEGQGRYSCGKVVPAASPVSALPASAPVGRAIDDFMDEPMGRKDHKTEPGVS